MGLVEFHRELLSDLRGQEAFRLAIFETVRGGETILDLGTGTGIHALFACQAGAKRVYAVEQHDIIELARAICETNGYGDRIVFVRGPVDQIDLPEPVDLIVTNQGLSGLLLSLPAARTRFLKPGGSLIPSSVEIFGAPVDARLAYEEQVGFWQREHYGLRFSPLRLIATNSASNRAIEREELLCEPVRFARFDFSHMTGVGIAENVRCPIARPGTLYGLGVWIEEWLTKETVISAAPPLQLPCRLWPNYFLPVTEPVRVESGDMVNVMFQIGAGGGAAVWSWEVTVQDQGGETKARSSHSSFAGLIFSKDTLRRQALDYTPRLNSLGEVQRFVLETCDGEKPLKLIEQETYERFPGLFRTAGQAAAFVGDVMKKFTS